jgi:hypothetical protein
MTLIAGSDYFIYTSDYQCKDEAGDAEGTTKLLERLG